MESPAYSHPPARSPRQRPPCAAIVLRPFVLVALGAALLLLSGCGGGEQSHPESSALVVGRRAAPTPHAQLAAAAAIARRFAAAYASAVYLRNPPPLPGTTIAVEKHIASDASAVPDDRRRLRSHAADFHLELLGADRLAGGVEIVDGHSPPFSVGFRVARTSRGWRVVSISTPE